MPPKAAPKKAQMAYSDSLLPPGNNPDLEDHFGTFVIKMGKAQWIQDANPHWGNLVYRVKFWGQTNDGLLLKPQNSTAKEKSDLVYRIATPIIGFHRYLEDMEKLKLYLVDPSDPVNQIYGLMIINLARHLNKDLSRNKVFHNLSGLYPVQKYFPNQDENMGYKMGYQQIDFECEFLLLQQQIDICKRLNQQTNVDYLTLLLKKQQQHYPIEQVNAAVQMPQTKVIFPTQQEQWLQQPPEQKLANVLFADNPFAPKSKEVQVSYQQNKYLENGPVMVKVETDSQRKQLAEEKTFKNANQQNQFLSQQHQDTPKQQQHPQDQESIHKRTAQTEHIPSNQQFQIQNYHCLHCCPSKAENIKPPGEHRNYHSSNKKESFKQARDSSSPIQRKESPPFRNPKPGSGDFSNTPTGYRYSKGDQSSKPKASRQVAQEKRERWKVSPPKVQAQDQQKTVQVEHIVETKSVQTVQTDNTPSMQVRQISPPPEKEKWTFTPQLESIRKLKLEVIDFHAYSQHVINRMNAFNIKNMFIECTFQNQSKRMFFRSQGQEQFVFNEHLEFDVMINELYFKEMTETNLKFSIQCYRQPENAQDSRYFKIQLGEGSFQVIKALNPEEYYVVIYTNLPFDRESNGSSQKSNLQYSVVNKEELQEYKQTLNRLGEIRIRPQFVRDEPKQNTQDTSFLQLYHSFNPTLLIKLGQIVGISDCYCRYKVPGTQDCFFTEKIVSGSFNHHSVSPFNYDSFMKIKSQPLLIEVWQEKGLVGVIRASLSPIHDILLQDEHLNSSIFKNIYPILIVDEPLQIKRLKDSLILGQLSIQIAFGTPSQVHKYQGEKQQKAQQNAKDTSIQYEEPSILLPNVQEAEPRQLTFEEQYYQTVPEADTKEYFISLFTHITKNKEIVLQQFPSDQFISIPQFEFLNFDNIAIFQVLHVLDYKNQSCVRREDLLSSYNSYCYHLPRVNLELSKQIRKLITFWRDQKRDPLEEVGNLLIQSRCGMMEVEHFLQSLRPFDCSYFKYFLFSQKLNMISIHQLNEYVCQFTTYGSVKIEQCQANYLSYQIQQSVAVKAQKVFIEENLKSTVLHLHQVQEIFQNNMIQLSFWEVYSLCSFIKEIKNHREDPWLIHGNLLVEWIEANNSQADPLQAAIEPPSSSGPNEQPHPKPPKRFQSAPGDQETRVDADSQPQFRKSIDFFVHRFSISLKQISNLKLTVPMGSQLQLEFKYPLCEQTVKSYPIIYSKQQQYQIPSDSNYTYIQQIEENSRNIDVVDCLEGGIQFKLTSNEQVLAQQLLSSMELANLMDKNQQFQKEKFLVLQPINAKFNLQISYNRQRMSQSQLTQDPDLLNSHNTISQKIHLPKLVSLKIFAEIQVNEKTLKFEDKLITAEIFSVASFKGSQPKQQGVRPIIINEEKPLNVDAQLIQALQTSPLIISVSTNSQELIGKCELNQSNLLRDGISGEFALTNSFGLFVGFAKLKCELLKYKIQNDVTASEAPEIQAYPSALILQFKEVLLNLKPILSPTRYNDVTYVYFGIKYNGKQHYTSPALLTKERISQELQGAQITLDRFQVEELVVQVYRGRKDTVNVIKDVKIGDVGISLTKLSPAQLQSEFLVLQDYFTLSYDSDIDRVGVKIVHVNCDDQQFNQTFAHALAEQPAMRSEDIQAVGLNKQQLQKALRLVQAQEAAFNQQKVGWHLDKQSFSLHERGLQTKLMEEVYKLQERGYAKQDRIEQVLEKYYICNFTDKSVNLFLKSSVLDKFAQGYLNYFDVAVFLAKINLHFQREEQKQYLIEIVRACNLHVLNQNKQPNPLIEVFVDGEVYRTQVQVREKDPVFNYAFSPVLCTNQNIEFRVINSGAEREYLGSAFVNSSEIIRSYEEGSANDIKIYIQGSRAQAYIILRTTEQFQKMKQVLDEVQQYEIPEELDVERIRNIIAQSII